MDAMPMDGASAADNGSGAEVVAVASPPSAGLAAASAGAGMVTNASSEMAPKPVAPLAGSASGTGSEGPQAEDDQMKQAVAANDAKCDDDKEGRLAVDVPQKGADGDVQKGSSSVKDGAATASVTPIAGAAEIPAVEDVTDAGRACKVRGFELCGRLLIFSIVPSHSRIYRTCTLRPSIPNAYLRANIIL